MKRVEFSIGFSFACHELWYIYLNKCFISFSEFIGKMSLHQKINLTNPRQLNILPTLSPMAFGSFQLPGIHTVSSFQQRHQCKNGPPTFTPVSSLAFFQCQHCFTFSPVSANTGVIFFSPISKSQFGLESIFHCSFIRDLLHRGDRAMIYLFIAGSYTPWLTLKSYQPDGWSLQLSWFIWVLAFLGILYQQLFHEQYKWLETTIYVTVALAPALAVLEMVSQRVTFFQHCQTHNPVVIYLLSCFKNALNVS